MRAFRARNIQNSIRSPRIEVKADNVGHHDDARARVCVRVCSGLCARVFVCDNIRELVCRVQTTAPAPARANVVSVNAHQICLFACCYISRRNPGLKSPRSPPTTAD